MFPVTQIGFDTTGLPAAAVTLGNQWVSALDAALGGTWTRTQKFKQGTLDVTSGGGLTNAQKTSLARAILFYYQTVGLWQIDADYTATTWTVRFWRTAPD